MSNGFAPPTFRCAARYAVSMRTTDIQIPARVWHALTAGIVLCAIAIQLALVVTDVNIGFGDEPQPLDRRLIEFFSYFTIQSNLLVGVTTGMLAFNPQRSGRVWSVIRAASMCGITVTIAIYHVVLSSFAAFEGLAAVSNIALHYVVPIFAIVGWIAFGPRDRLSATTLLWAAIWPVAYMIYTFLHGAATGFYPYPFVNVDRLGIGSVLLNAVAVTLLLMAVGALYWGSDRLLLVLTRRRRSRTS